MGWKISDLQGATLPLTGNELIEVTQGENSRSVRVSDLLPGFEDSLRTDLASAISPALGPGLIGFDKTLAYAPVSAGYALKQATLRYDDVVYVTGDYGAPGGGAKGDGVTDDYAAIIAARDFALLSGRKTLVFPQPTAFYATSQMLELAVADNFRIVGIGFPTIKYVGTSSVTAVVSMDRTIGGGRLGLGIENLNIQGNGHTNYALYMRAISHSKISNVRGWDAVIAGIRISSGVCNEYDNLRVTSVGGYGTPTLAPTDGIRLDAATAGDYVAWCTFRNSIAENVPGTGIILISGGATGNSFLGGTSEGNGRGINIGVGCHLNRFQHIDFEVNTNTLITDVIVNGNGNAFIGCQSLSFAASVNYSIQSAEGTLFYGGSVRAVNLQSSSKNTKFFGCRFSDHPSLGITGAGSYSAYGCVKEDNAGAISAIIPDRIPNIGFGADAGSTTTTVSIRGTGSTSATNSLLIRNVGGTVLFQARDDGVLLAPAAYALTTANPANCAIGSDGSISRSTSALKYKDVKGPIPQDMVDKVMGLSGFMYQQKDGGDGARLFVGMAADDFDVDGLRSLVSYGDDGDVEGLHYERLTVVLLEEMKALRARVAELEALPARVAELEKLTQNTAQ